VGFVAGFERTFLYGNGGNGRVFGIDFEWGFV